MLSTVQGQRNFLLLQAGPGRLFRQKCSTLEEVEVYSPGTYDGIALGEAEGPQYLFKQQQIDMLPDFESGEAALPLFRRLEDLSRDPGRYVRCIALNGAAIGFLNDVEISDGVVELGYCIHPDFQGKGYMTGALAAAMAELSSLGFREVIAGAFEENIPSIRVMEKCGLRQEGILRNRIVNKGEYVDTALWSILRSDWKQAQR